MSATNARIIDKAIKDYKLYIYDKTEETLREWCDDLLYSAIKWRLRDPLAHNFTGNLINSIVVGLYRNQTCIYACYAAGKVPKAIRPKMSGPRKRSYVFRPDYEGVNGSKYRPEIPTDKGWGENDAENFLMSYKPQGNNMFDIVVAYPVEYGEWVEMERGTTGILRTYEQAERVCVALFNMKRK